MKRDYSVKHLHRGLGQRYTVGKCMYRFTKHTQNSCQVLTDSTAQHTAQSYETRQKHG